MYAGAHGCLGEGDALLSETPGRLIGVKTADCLPVLLADQRHRAVAAVHAGWRGTVAEVCLSTLRAMAERWGTRPEDVHAAIGPGIGACCFEVGPEVAVRFGRPFERGHIDLECVNRTHLIGAGVAPERIYCAALCTVCHADLFHSFRRDRERAGRMISVIGVRPQPSTNSTPVQQLAGH